MASSGGVMDEIIDRRNKAVTFIALSDLLRHRPNKQKAKLIVPDHIGAVTPKHRIQRRPSETLLSLAHSLSSLSRTQYLPQI